MKYTDSTTRKVLAPTESKDMIDAFLVPLLQQLTEQARHINPHYETLWQDIQNLYTAGGKRLRSYMTLLAYESFSDQPVTTILPAAAAQELLHMAMLAHDDIIDRDDIRYGVKNITGQYFDHYEELIAQTDDRRHYANSAAILAGDLLISEAYTLISETGVAPYDILTAQRLISKAMFHVIGGELLDTEASFRGANAVDPLVIAEQKTASYSFVSPFLMGATLAGASDEQKNILQQLGEQLGIAYQLRDDLLGVFGDSEKTGKSTDGDLAEGKQTLLIKEFEKLASTPQRAEFHSLFGKRSGEVAATRRLKSLLIESGAKASVETLLDAYHEHTHRLLDTLTIDTAHKKAFSVLIDLCITREK
jgi:geranylgeranyl diphosphate synthase type II